MTHVITAMCLRDGGCVIVCPVECIVAGDPLDEWPWFYIDPDTCIDCGACVSECPYDAIYNENYLPDVFKAAGGERISMPAGTPGCDLPHKCEDYEGNPVFLDHTRTLEEGEIFPIRDAVAENARFFEEGPGYTIA